jgi:hypothetical protein
LSRRTAGWLFALVGACAIAFLSIWAVGSLIARPASWPVKPPAPPGRIIKLQAADGTRVEGSFWPGAHSGAAAVLLLHGIKSDRNMFDQHAAG